MQQSKEPDAFSAFERSGWNAAVEGYERAFGPLTVQTVGPTLDAAHITAGSRVLDVCTGHGVLALAAASRGAATAALDFAEEFVVNLKRKAPAIAARQGDAQALPYAADSFDAVICGYGIMHVPQPDRALAEMRRVLKPGGRIALSAWQKPRPDNGFGLLFGAIAAHGRSEVGLPHGPDFFQFGDGDSMFGALRDAGFIGGDARVVSQSWRFAQASDLVGAILGGAVRARALLEAQSPAARAAIAAAVEQGMKRQFAQGDGYRVSMPAILGSAAKA